jgi:hypothetical protein
VKSPAARRPSTAARAASRVTGIVLMIVVIMVIMAALWPPRAASASDGTATVVAVLGYHGSRLADEVKRELESSRFEVLSAEIGARRWQDLARTVDGGRLLRGVVVDENDRALTVYTRSLKKTDVDVRLVLSVDPADRMARRHACLSAVELLHALGATEGVLGTSPEDLSVSRPRGSGPIGGPAPSTPVSPSSARIPAEPLPRGPTAASGGGAPGASPPPSSPTSLEPPSDLAASASDMGWQLGAAATFGVETRGGGPTSHLQFVGRIPATPHLALGARVLWPLLAISSPNNGGEVRAWSFGAALTFEYTVAPRRRLKPYVGLGAGGRLGIIEVTSTTVAQSDQFFPVSGTLGIEAGVRYSLAPLVQVFFELSAARAWLIVPHRDDDLARRAADGESARASVGVLFTS